MVTRRPLDFLLFLLLQFLQLFAEVFILLSKTFTIYVETLY